MNRVGELVLVRNQIGQLANSDENSKYQASIIELNRVTTEIQEAVMQTRMREVGNAWKKIPRILHDLTSATGKKIQLNMVGAETELDRQVLDAIESPFIHMVRNSADHGIQGPEARREQGKPEVGTINLSAHHEGGYVIIEITDDGAGIDVEVIRRKALEKGLLTEEMAGALHDDDILNYIFEPGFSTAAVITNVSGRGVGMDVVRSKIQAIGGTVRLHTKLGEGTTVHIKIPLTFAIISALIVSCGEHNFAIPQVGVVELVRISSDNHHLIENVNGAEAMRLRGKLLSLVYLKDILGLESKEKDEKYIIVIQVDKKQFGLVVDTVHDTEEIVVKPLGRLVNTLPVYAGTTILGDGRVIMILDAAGLASSFGIMARLEAHRHEIDDAEHGDSSGGRLQRVRLLLFRAGPGPTQAIPLSLVSRLEEFDSAKIEQASGGFVIQYRGRLLPLVPAHPGLEIGTHDPQPVIVFTEGSRSLGLMVDEIRDITEEEMNIEVYGDKPGVIGSAIIKGSATEIIDLHHYIQQCSSNWFSASRTPSQAVGQSVLVIDDSDFFRNLLTPILMTAGHQVAIASDGEEALGLLEVNTPDVILCDIEMPRMDGLEFVRQVKSNPRFAEIPLIALTSHTSERDALIGKEAGFARYLSKIDTDAVLETIGEFERAAGAPVGAGI